MFSLGIYPTLDVFPHFIKTFLSWGMIFAGTLWFVKVWRCNFQRYQKERDSYLLRRQLQKLTIDWSEYLENRTLDTLTADELYTLARVLPGYTQQHRLQVYAGVLKDALEQNQLTPAKSLKVFLKLRQELGINEIQHYQALDKH